MNRFKALPRSRQIIVSVVAVAIVGCCGIAGLAALLPGGAEPTPTQAAALQPTTTPIPTETPTLTATPIPPTETPAPTDTAEPTETPQPTDTPSPSPTPYPTMTSPPTNTSLPTNTTAPTATPESTNSPSARVVISDVFNDSYTEHVKITNEGDGPADLSGWILHGSRGDEVYTFPDGYILLAGVTVRLHSGKNGIDAPPLDIYWTDKTVWNNDGETVYLQNAQGNLVDQYSY